MSVPTTQKAMIFETNNSPIEYKDIPVPKPAADEVLVNIKFTGVCHTDLHAWRGDWPLATKKNLVGGHEGAGVVVARGELVKNVEIGDHVGIKWLNGSCLACEFCRQADESLCAEALLSGYTVDGTFQQYAIGKANHVARIPKEIALDAVAPILCGGITVYKALKESGARAGQIVAVTGAGGGLGSIACQYAKAMGLRVIAIDGGDEKRDMCLKLGADFYVDFQTTKDLVKEVIEKTKGGPHAVILVAAAEKPFQEAAEYVRPRGTVVAVGLPSKAFLKAEVFSTVTKMITIKGSYVGNRQDTAEAIEFFRRGVIQAPFKVMGLSQLNEVFKLMSEGKIVGRIVLDTSK